MAGWEWDDEPVQVLRRVRLDRTEFTPGRDGVWRTRLVLRDADTGEELIIPGGPLETYRHQ